MQLWYYQAKLIRVVDGDTLLLHIDLGFDITYKLKLRIAGMNAPELPTSEGIQSAAFLRMILDHAVANTNNEWPFFINTKKRKSGDEVKSFERFIGDMYFYNDKKELQSVKYAMISEGYAVIYPE